MLKLQVGQPQSLLLSHSTATDLPSRWHWQQCCKRVKLTRSPMYRPHMGKHFQGRAKHAEQARRPSFARLLGLSASASLLQNA